MCDVIGEIPPETAMDPTAGLPEAQDAKPVLNLEPNLEIYYMLRTGVA